MLLWKSDRTIEIESVDEDSVLQWYYSQLRKNKKQLTIHFGFIRLFIEQQSDGFIVDVFKRKPQTLIMEIMMLSGVFWIMALLSEKTDYHFATRITAILATIIMIAWKRTSNPSDETLIQRLKQPYAFISRKSDLYLVLSCLILPIEILIVFVVMAYRDNFDLDSILIMLSELLRVAIPAIVPVIIVGAIILYVLRGFINRKGNRAST